MKVYQLSGHVIQPQIIVGRSIDEIQQKAKHILLDIEEAKIKLVTKNIELMMDHLEGMSGFRNDIESENNRILTKAQYAANVIQERVTFKEFLEEMKSFYMNFELIEIHADSE